MKKLAYAFTALCMLSACNSSETKSTDAAISDSSKAATEAPLTYAYTPTYTADFELGNPKFAQTVLDIWKDYDNNTFNNHKDAFADSVYMDLSGGEHFAGTKDSLIAMMTAYRTSLGTATDVVSVWTTLKPKGKDETWVLVWGKEIDEKDGKKDSVNLHEAWMFNKEGKISYMTQFSQKFPAAK